MNELNEAELDHITEGRCPTCKSLGFRLGPQGGAAINIECVDLQCKARFNAVMFGGRCLMGQRIPREKEGGSMWPASIKNQPVRHEGTFS